MMIHQLKLITPECEAKYIWLFTPNERFGSVYSVTCLIDDNPAWATLIKTVSDQLEEYYVVQCGMLKKKNLKRCEYLPWKTADDGTKVFVVKNNAIGTRKDGTTFETKPQILGPDKEPLDQSELKGSLGAGTRLRCGFTVNLWTNDAQGVGVSARLNFAQIIVPKYFSSMEQFASVEGDEIKSYEKDASLFKPRSKDQSIPEDEFLNNLSGCTTVNVDGLAVENIFARGRQV